MELYENNNTISNITAKINSENYIEENETEVNLKTIQEFEETHKLDLELGRKAAKLMENEDFIEVCLENYCKKEPSRIARLIGSGAMLENSVGTAFNDIIAAGKFSSYIFQIVERGKLLEEQLKDLKEEYEKTLSSVEY